RSEAVEHGEPEVGERGFARVADVAAGAEGAAGFARYQDRQVVVGMEVAVGQRAAVGDHAVVEQGAVAFANRFQLFHEIRELPDVVGVDRTDAGDLVGVVPVVGQFVMAAGDADHAVLQAAAFTGEHAGGNSRHISLERQGQNV